MAGSLDKALLDFYNAKHLNGSVIDDTPVAIRLRYKGTGTITSVTIVTATSLTMITSDGGTEAFAFATYTTVGSLVDAINGSSYWEAKALDGLRADASASVFVDGAITIGSDGYYDVKTDTSALKSYSYRITADRDLGKSKAGNHRVKMVESKYNVNINAASDNGFRIYEWDPTAKTEVQVYRAASVDATATTVNIASGNSTLDASKPGNDLIVRIIDGTSITDGAANYLNVAYIVE